jgi:hypothetical protein
VAPDPQLGAGKTDGERLVPPLWRHTTITAYQGAMVMGDLVLTGACSTCGGPVRRLIEGDD